MFAILQWPRFPEVRAQAVRAGTGARVLGWLLVLFLLACDSMGQSPYQLKAAVLGNLAKFIEWPEGTFASPSDPVRLGIFGEDPFGPDLETILKPIKPKGRELVVIRSDKASDLEGCQIVFVSTKETERSAALIRELRGKPVFLAGEDPRFLELGGMLNFFMEDRKVRFAIQLESTERARLALHPQLLKLASAVKKREAAR